MRLGIFGGSFNPVHYGHLLLAETCREQARLDQVWFMPASIPPHKQETDLADNRHRIAMLELAIAGYPPFQISQLELERGGVSYTVDTLRRVKESREDAELFFLMGADSLAEFGSWRMPEEICRLATPLVVRRAGSPPPALDALEPFADEETLRSIEQHEVSMPVIELSSTHIRRASSQGKSIRFQTPRAVERYIQTNGLYAQS